MTAPQILEQSQPYMRAFMRISMSATFSWTLRNLSQDGQVAPSQRGRRGLAFVHIAASISQILPLSARPGPACASSNGAGAPGPAPHAGPGPRHCGWDWHALRHSAASQGALGPQPVNRGEPWLLTGFQPRVLGGVGGTTEGPTKTSEASSSFQTSILSSANLNPPPPVCPGARGAL